MTIFYFQAVRNSCHHISANDSTYDHVASFMCCWLHVFVQQNWARALVAKLCWTIFLQVLWDWEMYINLWDSQKILESWHAWKICPATGSLWILSEESGWIISCQSCLPIYFSYVLGLYRFSQNMKANQIFRAVKACLQSRIVKVSNLTFVKPRQKKVSDS